MKFESKRPKVARTTTDEQEDRLSSLPDPILCHILSFVPTKYAAMTSILSTRWKNLFLGVPIIDLDDSLVLKPQDKQVKNGHFKNFVNRRLMLRMTSSITEFRLKCQKLPKAHVFDLWLTTLFSCNVKVLEIEQQRELEGILNSAYSSPLWPPSGIFQMETLVVLKLCGWDIRLTKPEFVSFPNLKIFVIESLVMQFESNNFRLAEGFPLLEELRLVHIRCEEREENEALIISMLTLKRLAIFGMERYFSRIDIDTPHLQHLECENQGFGFMYTIPKMQINLCLCESLVSACIRIDTGFEDTHQWFIDFLSKINNVKELDLSKAFAEVLSCYPFSLPHFPNLTHLVFSGMEESMWNLRQHTPNLKVLVCCLHTLVAGNDFLQENEPLCLIQSLREITIKEFDLEEAEFGVVKYFLQHGAVLQRLIIEHHDGNGHQQP